MDGRLRVTVMDCYTTTRDSLGHCYDCFNPKRTCNLDGPLYSRRILPTRSKKTKTYNRRDSQMVTHSSTSRPVQCLCMAERTGCPVLTDLWSYVSVNQSDHFYPSRTYPAYPHKPHQDIASSSPRTPHVENQSAPQPPHPTHTPNKSP